MSTIIMIDGGNVFASQEQFLNHLRTVEIDPFQPRREKWKEWLGSQLGSIYILPKMPNDWNAQYVEWSIWFERHLEYADEELFLIGHSLGGSFLLQYLSEHELSVSHLYLVAPAISDDGLEDESLGEFTPDLSAVRQIHCDDIHLFASTDDFVVPFAQAEQLQEHMQCTFHRFTDRNHFLQETFPELLEEIRKVLEK